MNIDIIIMIMIIMPLPSKVYVSASLNVYIANFKSIVVSHSYTFVLYIIIYAAPIIIIALSPKQLNFD